MPRATPTHTPSPVVVALQLAASRLQPLPPTERGSLTYQDSILREACRSAQITHGAMLALSMSVADLPPADPRHGAADSATALLREQWEDEVAQAWSVPATGPAGLRDKAELLDSLVDPDPDGSVPGSPALALAASLAADVLALHGATAA